MREKEYKNDESNGKFTLKFSDIPQITYANYRVNIPWSHLERAISGYIKDYNLELEPDFQRNHVWTKKQQAQYVEWILKGGKSGRDIFFNCPCFSKMSKPRKMVLVDGLQRLTAVRLFLKNKVKIFNEYFLEDFEDKIPIGGPDFVFYVNDLESRKEILQWYIDINSGGTPHTEEEIKKVKYLLKKEK